MKKILLVLFIMVSIISNNAKAQFNYYASVEGGGGIGGGIRGPGIISGIGYPIAGGGVGVVGATGTISYGEKIEWGFTTGIKSYFGAVTSEDTYYTITNFGKHLDNYILTTSTVLIVPLIASLTYNFQEQGNITPFLSINGGYGLQVNASDIVRSNNYTFGCEAGIKHRNIKGSIFYNYQGYTYDIASYVNYNTDTSTSFSHINTVGAKITYCFNGVRKSSRME
jgi:hypothetical protein